jgi:hypothetical protein
VVGSSMRDSIAVRVVVDYNCDGDLIALAYEQWVDGEPVKAGWRPVGPFDKPSDLEQWVVAHAGIQLALDLT